MNTKIVEVLAKILDGLNKNYTLDDVNKNLSKDDKFDKQTVSAAFSLVYDKVVFNKMERELDDSSISGNIRILSEEEIDVVGLNHYNYLIYLQNIGLIDSYDFENLLEQILLFPSNKVTLEDINWMVLISLVDSDSQLLPGSRATLFSTDTIN